MATERRAEAVLRALAAESVPAEDAATVERRRRRVVEATALAIARASNERQQRQRRRRWGQAAGALASAAAIALVAGALWRIRAPAGLVAGDSTTAVARGESLVGTLHRSHQGEALPTVAGQLALGAGDDVTTEPGGRGEVVLADGVAITLESATHVRLPDTPADPGAKAHEEVGLAGGMVSVRVPPMAPGHTFAIKTPDARVTVHGTAFTVEVAPPRADIARAEPATRVRVATGVVSVTSAGREVVLTAGMEWASPIVPSPVQGSAPAALASVPTTAMASALPKVASAATTAGRGTHRDEGASGGAPRSRLGEENQLLSGAIASSKTGDYAGAVATLDDLLHRFPGSTLAQEAHVERFRALARGSDRAAAAKEARLYLALYPDGFAREEARGLAVGW